MVCVERRGSLCMWTLCASSCSCFPAYFTLQRKQRQRPGPLVVPTDWQDKASHKPLRLRFCQLFPWPAAGANQGKLSNTTQRTFIVPSTSHLIRQSDFLPTVNMYSRASLNVKMRYTLFKLLGNAAHDEQLRQTLNKCKKWELLARQENVWSENKRGARAENHPEFKRRTVKRDWLRAERASRRATDQARDVWTENECYAHHNLLAKREVWEIKGLRSAGRSSPSLLSLIILSGLEKLSSCESAEASPLP